jgi:chromosome segregation ATPase
MQDYQTLALSYAEELSDLKRRYANLERHCRGLESKLSNTRGRMKMYRERCKAWERALDRVDELYHLADRNADTPEDMAKAYSIAYCATVIRREVEPAYRHDPSKIRRKVLNRTHQPEESGE